MRSDFLGSIHFNKNNDLLVSSSNLTFEKWTGRVAFIAEPNVCAYVTPSSSTEARPFKLLRANAKKTDDQEKDPNMSMIRYMTGITRVKWAYDEQHFLAASELGHIELFKVTSAHQTTPGAPDHPNIGSGSGNYVASGSGSTSVSSAPSSPSSSPNATAASNGDAYVFESMMYAKEHESLVGCLETRLDGPLALTGSDDSKIKIWDLNEQISTRTFKAHDDAVCSLSLHPTDQNLFISCSQDGRALLWDTRKPKPAFLISHHLSGHPSSSCWGSKQSSSGCNLIALGSEIGQLGVYDVRSLSSERPYLLARPHNRLVRRVKFNPSQSSSSSRVIASASEDCKTCVLRLIEPSVLTEPGQAAVYQFKHRDYVTDLVWTSPKEYLTSSWDGTLRKHQIELDSNGHV